MIILILIAIVILIIACLITIILSSEKENGYFFFIIMTLITLFGITIRLDSYKKGQIDALSKKRIAYELIKQDDGSTKWMPKED